ncbi:MAG: hypothetical protein LBK56_06900 [Gracilibacteraceae bacterium]|jgi:hypothetical protein|nr:hypothetical protein [Gracilibacteraceae bacterium]
MERSFVIWQNILERIASKPELENIILGTGSLARDLQNKLRLLNLKAPFLVGGRDDPGNGIRHYSRIAELEEAVERYRFIVCFDADEWALIAPAQSAVFQQLGIAAYNHPRVTRLTGDSMIYEQAGEFLTDANIQNLFVHDDRPYAIYGDQRENRFTIHLLGDCHASGLFRYTKRALPELLYERLRRKGFEVNIYAWGHPRESGADCLLQFLRDGIAYEANLVILEKNVIEFDALHVSRRNLLPIQAGTGVHEYISQLRSSYTDEIGNGLDHDVEAAALWKTQHHVFLALAKQFGFTFWNIITPSGQSLPEDQARKLLNLSPGYLARRRKQKDAAVAAVKGECVKDYTDSFKDVDNIFEMYADISHLTDKGNEIIAKRCADDIVQAFGGRIRS